MALSRLPGLTVPALAECYHISLLDWAPDGWDNWTESEPAGILFISGDGLMLAAMDQLWPRVRWVVSIEHLHQVTRNLRSFAEAVDWLCTPVVVIGWFSLDPIEPAHELATVFTHPVVYLKPDHQGEVSWTVMVEKARGGA